MRSVYFFYFQDIKKKDEQVEPQCVLHEICRSSHIIHIRWENLRYFVPGKEFRS